MAFFHTTLKKAVAFYTENPPKGEFVLVIEGCAEKAVESFSLDEAVLIAKDKMKEGLSASEAAKFASSVSGIKKGEIYKGIV